MLANLREAFALILSTVQIALLGRHLSSLKEIANGEASTLQVFIFAVAFLGFWAAERISRSEPIGLKLRHSAFNAAFLIGVLPVQLSLITLCIAAANWTTRNHFGLIYLLPDSENRWLRYCLLFFALDFLDYAYHVSSHRFRPIWRLHLVHHSDRELDVSTTFREHPAETGIRVAFLIGFALFCGASLQVLILRQTAQTFANLLQHTRFNLSPRLARIFGFVFVTPNLHHIHHHHEQPGTNCNYGDIFSVWDRLFGTFVDLPADAVVFGLDTHAAKIDLTISELLGWGGFMRWWQKHSNELPPLRMATGEQEREVQSGN